MDHGRKRKAVPFITESQSRVNLGIDSGNGISLLFTGRPNPLEADIELAARESD